ncbi:enoyl-CoA hydratase-related protein [Paracoccaceae bacterium GXU_MW_L88]
MYEQILYDVTENVATITFNRPQTKNGLTSQMRREIIDAVAKAEGEARVLVFTGAEGAFCSGQDLSDTKHPSEIDFEAVLRDEYEPMLNAIYNCKLPTVAAVNGPAAGAGANLALAADIVIATESAVFIQAFARIGLLPDAGGTYWLPRQMGFSKAMGAALLAEPITAKQADDWGMIWASFPDDAFTAEQNRIAQKLANGPTLAYRHIKEALRGSYDKSLNEQLAVEAKAQGVLGQSADFLEGVIAFLQKRIPNYQGK